MISFGRQLDDSTGGEDESLDVSFGNNILAWFLHEVMEIRRMYTSEHSLDLDLKQ